MLLYGMSVMGAFAVMHVFLSPHPSPIAAGEYVGVNVGVVMLIGLAIALPTWWLAGYFLGTRMGKKWLLLVPDLLVGGPMDGDQPVDPPSAGAIIGLMSATVVSGGFNGVQLVAIVIATAVGSIVASHVNDSGFWLVGRLMGMDVATTLRTWAVMETAISVIGFALSAIVFYGAGMFG